jgi:cytochrome c553
MKWKRNLSAFCVGLTLTFAPAVHIEGFQRGRARPEVDRPDGPVWEVIRANCISCHGIDDYAFYALDRSEWDATIETWHDELGVTLTEEQRTLLLDYLAAEFGPDSTPFPRSYIPPEITEFLTDPEAYRLIDRSCTSCHDRARFDDERNSQDGWRVVLVDMRERGAVLTDEELEELAEWLSRVKGINPNQ